MGISPREGDSFRVDYFSREKFVHHVNPLNGDDVNICGVLYHSVPSDTNRRQLYMMALLTCNCMPPEFRRSTSPARAPGQGSPLPWSGHERRLGTDGRLTQARDDTVVSGSTVDPTASRSVGRGQRLHIRHPVRPTPSSLRAPPTVSSSSSPCRRAAFRPFDPAEIRLDGVAVHTDGVSAPPCSITDLPVSHHLTCLPGSPQLHT